MRRIVVLGGLGFFGAAAAERLRADGLAPLTASRRPAADLPVDVEDPISLRAALRPGDIVIDAVGPFQDRTATLVHVALDVGFDVIDISDSLAHVGLVYALEARINASGGRVLTACSSISAISAALVRLSGVADPVRVTGFLAPVSRSAANAGAAGSLLRSIGRPVRVWRDGRWATQAGWREARTFRAPPPLGALRGRLFESADSLTLPRIWPSLHTVDFFIDSQVPALNWIFSLAARSPVARSLITHLQTPGMALARRLGSGVGCLGYEIEAGDGRVTRCALVASARGYFIPIVPAVLAARAIAAGRFAPGGLVPPDRHVEPAELLDYLGRLGARLIWLT